jgi:hypothetical protein
VALCDALEKARNELRVASTALSSASSAKDAAARDTWLLKVSKLKHQSLCVYQWLRSPIQAMRAKQVQEAAARRGEREACSR